MASDQRINIVFFGSARAGKSSIVNMLTEKYNAEVSNESIGCTLEHKRYPYENFNFYDTAGLNEASQGSLDPKNAIKNLISLLRSLKSGVGLLVHVWHYNNGPCETMEKNYKLFAKAICHSEVPVILAVTNCEMHSKMDKWWQDNRSRFEKAGLHYSEVQFVCGTNGSGPGSPDIEEDFLPVIEKKYRAAREPLLRCIEAYALRTGWTMPYENWFVKTVKNVVNFLWNSLGWGNIFPNLVDYLMKTFGFSKEWAEEVNEAYEEATAN